MGHSLIFAGRQLFSMKSSILGPPFSVNIIACQRLIMHCALCFLHFAFVYCGCDSPFIRPQSPTPCTEFVMWQVLDDWLIIIIVLLALKYSLDGREETIENQITRNQKLWP